MSTTYLIEDNIDFYKELNNTSFSENNDQCCLITNKKLDETAITLDCGHKFNYSALFNSIKFEKQNNNLDYNKKLPEWKFTCPYCRNINKKLIPYWPLKNIKLINGVNSPNKYCMIVHKCQWTFRYGKNKNSLCNKSAYYINNNLLCSNHHKFSNDIFIWNNENDPLCGKYKINELKEILKNNKLKVSGSKKQLIDRLLKNNIKLDK